MRPDDLKSEINKLNMAEKLVLVEGLWDDIATSNNSIPLYEWQKKELNDRLELYNTGELKTYEWTSAHTSLRKKY